MPIKYQLHPGAEFIDTQCIGDVALAEVLDHFRELEADTRLPKRLDVLLDLSEMLSSPESGQMRAVADELKRMMLAVHWGTFAVVATSDVLFGMTRMLQVFAEEYVEQLRVFRSRKEAEAWMTDTREPGCTDR